VILANLGRLAQRETMGRQELKEHREFRENLAQPEQPVDKASPGQQGRRVFKEIQARPGQRELTAQALSSKVQLPMPPLYRRPAIPLATCTSLSTPATAGFGVHRVNGQMSARSKARPVRLERLVL
jgi:hypothetical protein